VQKLDAGRLKAHLASLVGAPDHTVRNALADFAAAEGISV